MESIEATKSGNSLSVFVSEGSAVLDFFIALVIIFLAL